MYAYLGMEVAVMIGGKDSSRISYTGSPKGMDFMSKRLDILTDFVIFSRGKCVHMYYMYILFFVVISEH